jgi:hypothetical protein
LKVLGQRLAMNQRRRWAVAKVDGELKRGKRELPVPGTREFQSRKCFTAKKSGKNSTIIAAEMTKTNLNY